MLWWILFLFGWFVAAFWAAGAYQIPRFVREGMIDERAASMPEPKNWPKVSVVVPAREVGLEEVADGGFGARTIVFENDGAVTGTERKSQPGATRPASCGRQVGDLPTIRGAGLFHVVVRATGEFAFRDLGSQDRGREQESGNDQQEECNRAHCMILRETASTSRDALPGTSSLSGEDSLARWFHGGMVRDC